MIRGTNAQFKFKLPYRKEELLWVTIKFWQSGNDTPLLPITKKLEQCGGPSNSTELYVSLTSEETMRFSEKYKAKVQLRSQHMDGTIFGSHTQLITVYPMNDDILEEDPNIPIPDDNNGVIVFDGKSI